jgi:ATP adenylyltransferase
VTTTEPADELAGEPDGFQRLWTPHRMAYIRGEGKPTDKDAGPGCPFCRVADVSDEEALVVARGVVAFVVLNLYPYNAGHLLVCPYRHVADYTDLTPEEVAEIADLTATAMRVVRAVSAPAGFNLGINQGEVAGAGIDAHLHQHVVPRWRGDANFLPVVARTRAIPELLADTRERLAAAWPTGSPTTEGMSQ